MHTLWTVRELMQWCELRAWLCTDLSKAGALPYLGICLGQEVVRIGFLNFLAAVPA